MTDITPERIGEIAALADELPERYQVAAFRELVRHELGEARGRSDTNSGSGQVVDRVTPPEADELPELSAIKTMDSRAKSAWAIIELTRRDEPATAESIGKLIKDELGTSPPANMSRTLKSLTPEYASRSKYVNGYKYTPNKNTTQLLRTKKDDGG